jgi:hypothetical protein
LANASISGIAFRDNFERDDRVEIPMAGLISPAEGAFSERDRTALRIIDDVEISEAHLRGGFFPGSAGQDIRH